LSSRATGFFSNFTASGWKALGIAFLVGFFVRLVPELLSYPHAIGFDTVYYAWRIGTGVVWYNWSQVFSSWLLYGLLVPVQNLVQGDPFMILKLAAPLLFGLNTCGIYYFARRALNWTERKALFGSLVFSFQIAALAISWEFYRNMLGLGFLLFALAFLEDVGKSVKASLFFVLFSVLVMFSHEFTSIILFIVVLCVVAFTVLKKTKLTAIRVLGFFAPALAVFLGQVYFVTFPIVYAGAAGNVLIAYQTTGHYRGVFSLFTNYLGVFDTVQSYSSYLVLFSHVFSLFVLLFALVLPLVLVGFFRNKLLVFWSGLLLVGGFGAVVMPWFAPDMWSRWMLMLVYPFTFYVVNGIGKVWHAGGSCARPIWARLNWLRISKRVAESLLVVSSCLGFVFMACPMLYGRFGLVGLPTTVNYVPSSMQSNTLPLIDVDSTVNALKWINNRMNSSSAFLAQDAFYDWSKLCLDNKNTIVYFKNDFRTAIATANVHGFDTLYFIWWNTDIGWYGITTPSSFVQLMSYDRISVYLYVG
jgi:hypothetical protein